MDRALREFPRTQVIGLSLFPLTLIGGGSGKAPVLGEGDPNGTWFSQPVFTSTGIWSITTKDGFPGVASVGTSICLASPAAGSLIVESGISVPSTTTPFTCTFTFNVYNSGSLYDLGTTDAARLRFYIRNSGVLGY